MQPLAMIYATIYAIIYGSMVIYGIVSSVDHGFWRARPAGGAAIGRRGDLTSAPRLLARPTRGRRSDRPARRPDLGSSLAWPELFII